MATISELQEMLQDPKTSPARRQWIENALAERGVPSPQTEPKPATATTQEASRPFSVTNMLGNVPGSAANFIGDMVQPFIDPIGTATSMGTMALAAGGDQLMNRGMEAIGMGNPGMDFSREREMIGQALDDRYGGTDQLLNTLENDPVGLLADGAALVSGGAMAGSRLPGLAGTVSRGVGNAARYADPVVPLSKASSVLAPQALGNKLYESSAKFSTTDTPEERALKLKVGMDNDITFDRKGQRKLKRRLNEVGELRDSLFDQAEAMDTRVSMYDISRPFINLSNRKSDGVSLDTGGDTRQLANFEETLLESIRDMRDRGLVDERGTMGVKDVQNLKEDAYDRVNWNQQNQQGEALSNEATRAVGRGAKLALEEAIPGIDKVNQQMRGLIMLDDPTNRAANRIGNRNPIGLPQIGMGGTGMLIDAVAGTPGVGTAAGLGAGVLNLPSVGSRLGIFINKINRGDYGWINSVPAATARQALAAAGRSSEEIERIMNETQNTED